GDVDAVSHHPTHQRVDRSFTHADTGRERAGDLVGIALAAREQGKHAQFKCALLELNLIRGVRHHSIDSTRVALYSKVLCITRYLLMLISDAAGSACRTRS